MATIVSQCWRPGDSSLPAFSCWEGSTSLAVGARKHRCQKRRLRRVEAGCLHAEIMACRGFGSEDVFAPFRDVQIDFENAALVHRGLEHCGKNRLLALAQHAALARKKQVLCELLGDGRAPGDDFPAPLVLVHRPLDAFPIETFVIDEL